MSHIVTHIRTCATYLCDYRHTIKKSDGGEQTLVCLYTKKAQETLDPSKNKHALARNLRARQEQPGMTVRNLEYVLSPSLPCLWTQP